MQMGQLLDEDASRRSMAAMAGGRLRHLVKLYELADLGSSRREMSIADGSNCRQANYKEISSHGYDTQTLLAVIGVSHTKKSASR
jgi:hypothetical protein